MGKRSNRVKLSGPGKTKMKVERFIFDSYRNGHKPLFDLFGVDYEFEYVTINDEIKESIENYLDVYEKGFEIWFDRLIESNHLLP